MDIHVHHIKTKSRVHVPEPLARSKVMGMLRVTLCPLHRFRVKGTLGVTMSTPQFKGQGHTRSHHGCPGDWCIHTPHTPDLALSVSHFCQSSQRSGSYVEPISAWASKRRRNNSVQGNCERTMCSGCMGWEKLMVGPRSSPGVPGFRLGRGGNSGWELQIRDNALPIYSHGHKHKLQYNFPYLSLSASPGELSMHILLKGPVPHGESLGELDGNRPMPEGGKYHIKASINERTDGDLTVLPVTVFLTPVGWLIPREFYNRANNM
ncbi:hypothetical protein MAR_014133 [Mya arenaria]|uniref:Uncharacterized protein n=1 Tax=Mya arenaria TaxID=6604 RepID=A0ABY7G536_MYAAR|nr:hypothetical protein MAR_014133 [Mya arenaria]